MSNPTKNCGTYNQELMRFTKYRTVNKFKNALFSLSHYIIISKTSPNWSYGKQSLLACQSVQSPRKEYWRMHTNSAYNVSPS